MTTGEGIAFAAMMWAGVQIAYLWGHMLRRVTTDEVKAQLDRIEQRFKDVTGD